MQTSLVTEQKQSGQLLAGYMRPTLSSQTKLNQKLQKKRTSSQISRLNSSNSIRPLTKLLELSKSGPGMAQGLRMCQVQGGHLRRVSSGLTARRNTRQSVGQESTQNPEGINKENMDPSNQGRATLQERRKAKAVHKSTFREQRAQNLLNTQPMNVKRSLRSAQAFLSTKKTRTGLAYGSPQIKSLAFRQRIARKRLAAQKQAKSTL